MKFKAVTQNKLYTQIASQISASIEDGDLKPGEQLPNERELAQQLNVSRPSLREALVALEVAGLIDIRVGVGAFVRMQRESPGFMPEYHRSPVEIIEARQLIEPQVAALAAAVIDDASIEELEEVLGLMQQDTARSEWSPVHDRALHTIVVRNCPNTILREIAMGLWSARDSEIDQKMHGHLAELESVRSRILMDHRLIVEAMKHHDVESARKAMHDHMMFVSDTMSAAWD
ncbi:MAG: hypothetical protein CML23_15615 [Rhizobiaceae bacterium]|nr:hypothetical protein [Rhizobiaceae bacterium]|tara:strand:- start:285 stop:977 length:693 start_codon:yes stop_codon:yes gene_type:complete